MGFICAVDFNIFGVVDNDLVILLCAGVCCLSIIEIMKSSRETVFCFNIFYFIYFFLFFL